MNTDPFSKENLITIFALSTPRVLSWCDSVGVKYVLLGSNSLSCWINIPDPSDKTAFLLRWS